MKICFVLPGVARQPVGGYKIVYEYANRLVKENCDVTILYLNQDFLKNYHVPYQFKKKLAHIYTNVEPKWFNLDKKVQKVSSLDKNYKSKLKKIDICFATSAEKTVEAVKKIDATKKFYLIQGYENWNISNEDLIATYKLGFENIVIANWLKEIVDKHSKKPSILIPNAINTKIYKNEIQILKRPNHSIALLYHTAPKKGLKQAFKVIKKLKSIYPDLEVTMFGQFPKPDIPSWITYYRGASQSDTVRIYNSSKVFLCSTIEEGFGLTGIEAMACGACLVSTNYKGVREYAVDEYNSLLSPVGDVQAQVSNVQRIFENPELQEKISQNGVKSCQNFDWNTAMQRFNQAIGYHVEK